MKLFNIFLVVFLTLMIVIYACGGNNDNSGGTDDNNKNSDDDNNKNSDDVDVSDTKELNDGTYTYECPDDWYSQCINNTQYRECGGGELHTCTNECPSDSFLMCVDRYKQANCVCVGKTACSDCMNNCEKKCNSYCTDYKDCIENGGSQQHCAATYSGGYIYYNEYYAPCAEQCLELECGTGI